MATDTEKKFCREKIIIKIHTEKSKDLSLIFALGSIQFPLLA